MLGIGAIVGAGIFSTVGTAAAGGGEHIGAGPGADSLFVLVAVASAFAALCYSEFAAMVPVSGSVYTYAVRHAGGVGGVDYWVGPGAGICCGQHRGSYFLVGLFSNVAASFSCALA